MRHRLTENDFKKRSIEIHGNKYRYDKFVYLNNKIKGIIACPLHGDFYQRANDHLQGKGCPKCYLESKFLTNNKFITKAKIIHDSKYDYSKVNYIDHYTKVDIICPTHGLFKQTPNAHLKGFGCDACGGVRKSDSYKFEQDSKKVHGEKYDYSRVRYVGNKNKVELICSSHGSFWQTPNNHLGGAGCPRCNESKGEIAIAKFLEKHKISYVREYKIPGTNYRFEYDFYLPEHNLLIEFHGVQHYKPRELFGGEEGLKQTQFRDAFKLNLARECRIPLIEFNYRQFDKGLEEFESMLFLSLRKRNILFSQ